MKIRVLGCAAGVLFAGAVCAEDYVIDDTPYPGGTLTVGANDTLTVRGNGLTSATKLVLNGAKNVTIARNATIASDIQVGPGLTKVTTAAADVTVTYAGAIDIYGNTTGAQFAMYGSGTHVIAGGGQVHNTNDWIRLCAGNACLTNSTFKLGDTDCKTGTDNGLYEKAERWTIADGGVLEGQYQSGMISFYLNTAGSVTSVLHIAKGGTMHLNEGDGLRLRGTGQVLVDGLLKIESAGAGWAVNSTSEASELRIRTDGVLESSRALYADYTSGPSYRGRIVFDGGTYRATTMSYGRKQAICDQAIDVLVTENGGTLDLSKANSDYTSATNRANGFASARVGRWSGPGTLKILGRTSKNLDFFFLCDEADASGRATPGIRFDLGAGVRLRLVDNVSGGGVTVPDMDVSGAAFVSSSTWNPNRLLPLAIGTATIGESGTLTLAGDPATVGTLAGSGTFSNADATIFPVVGGVDPAFSGTVSVSAGMVELPGSDTWPAGMTATTSGAGVIVPLPGATIDPAKVGGTANVATVITDDVFAPAELTVGANQKTLIRGSGLTAATHVWMTGGEILAESNATVGAAIDVLATSTFRTLRSDVEIDYAGCVTVSGGVSSAVKVNLELYGTGTNAFVGGAMICGRYDYCNQRAGYVLISNCTFTVGGPAPTDDNRNKYCGGYSMYGNSEKTIIGAGGTLLLAGRAEYSDSYLNATPIVEKVSTLEILPGGLFQWDSGGGYRVTKGEVLINGGHLYCAAGGRGSYVDANGTIRVINGGVYEMYRRLNSSNGAGGKIVIDGGTYRPLNNTPKDGVGFTAAAKFEIGANGGTLDLSKLGSNFSVFTNRADFGTSGAWTGAGAPLKVIGRTSKPLTFDFRLTAGEPTYNAGLFFDIGSNVTFNVIGTADDGPLAGIGFAGVRSFGYLDKDTRKPLPLAVGTLSVSAALPDEVRVSGLTAQDLVVKSGGIWNSAALLGGESRPVLTNAAFENGAVWTVPQVADRATLALPGTLTLPAEMSYLFGSGVTQGGLALATAAGGIAGSPVWTALPGGRRALFRQTENELTAFPKGMVLIFR